ncbi:MAG TPA: hypothetical protein VL096_00845, partial [Pirellulaceae bacterium]|nr:hypothetical protein [Pirellulaceae bacterium]
MDIPLSTDDAWRSQLLKVAGLFAAQSVLLLAIWLPQVQLWSNSQGASGGNGLRGGLLAICFGWCVALACWVATWLTLSSARGWRWWLESMLVLGAAYWPLVLTNTAAFRWLRLIDRDVMGGYDGKANYHAVMAGLFVLVVPFALISGVFRFSMGFRLHWFGAVTNARVGLRELFLLILVVSLHLACGREFLRSAFTWNGWGIGLWLLTQFAWHLGSYAVTIYLIFLGLTRLMLGSASFQRCGWLLLLCGTTGLIALMVWRLPAREMGEAVIMVGCMCFGLAANTLTMAFCLRWLGWRLESESPWT